RAAARARGRGGGPTGPAPPLLPAGGERERQAAGPDPGRRRARRDAARTRAGALPEAAAMTRPDEAAVTARHDVIERTASSPPSGDTARPESARGARAAGVVRRIPGGRRPLACLASAGPGLVAANAGNDAAGIATYSSAGSQFVYRTLFFMLLVTIALVIVQEMAIRLGIFTGKGIGALIREQFSLRLTGVALFCVLLANTGLVVSEFAGIGAAFELLGVSRYWVTPPAAVLIWGLVLFGSYRYAERIFLILSLAFFAYPVAAILG